MSLRFFAETPLYEVQELLGESPLSEVYLSFRKGPDFKIPVVIKLFRQKKLADLQMESLLRAPSGAHLIKVISFETLNSRPALIMEYIEGVDLNTLKRQGGFSEDEKACICSQALKGLKALKKVGLSHGDLSLSNILINRQGQLYLTDYGLANYAKGAYGTQPFLAPELLKGQQADFASDLFSLGVLEKVLQGADPLTLKNDHFICEGDPLLAPQAFKRKEKEFSFSPKAFSDLGERVSSALMVKKCLPTPSHPSLAHKFNQSKGQHPLSWGLLSLSLLVFLVNPFVSYGQYKPRPTTKPAVLYIRSQKWLFVEIAGVSGYTPLAVQVQKPGLYKLKWKSKKKQGTQYVYLTAGQKTGLTDKDFFKNKRKTL